MSGTTTPIVLIGHGTGDRPSRHLKQLSLTSVPPGLERREVVDGPINEYRNAA